MDYSVGIGALGFLGINSKGHSELDNYFQEWSYVTLRDATIPQGHIIKIKEENNSVKLFSIDDETIYNENLERIQKIKTTSRVSVYQMFNMAKSTNLANTLVTITKMMREVHPTSECVERLDMEI